MGEILRVSVGFKGHQTGSPAVGNWALADSFPHYASWIQLLQVSWSTPDLSVGAGVFQDALWHGTEVKLSYPLFQIKRSLKPLGVVLGVVNLSCIPRFCLCVLYSCFCVSSIATGIQGREVLSFLLGAPSWSSTEKQWWPTLFQMSLERRTSSCWSRLI